MSDEIVGMDDKKRMGAVSDEDERFFLSITTDLMETKRDTCDSRLSTDTEVVDLMWDAYEILCSVAGSLKLPETQEVQNARAILPRMLTILTKIDP